MAEELDRGDIVAIVAYGSRNGDTRIVYRYRHTDTTRIVENGIESEGEASDTPTWWR